jgi:hypothetical protein
MIRPHWIMARLGIDGEDYNSPSAAVIPEIVRETVALGGVRYWFYSPFREQSHIYIAFDLEPSVSPDEFIERARPIYDPSRWKKWSQGTDIRPFDGFSVQNLGGESLIPLLGATQQALSEETLHVLSKRPSNLQVFTLAANAVLLDALGLTPEEKSEVYRQQIDQLKIATGLGPGHEAWQKSFETLSRALKPIEVCFPKGQADLDAIEEVLGPIHATALRQLEEKVQRAAHLLDRESTRSWSEGMEYVLAKRVAHPQWLRIDLDNLKESLSIAWLVR